MKVKLDIGAKMPTQAHPGKDAGWDLYAPEDIVVPARRGILWWRREGSVTIDTGVHVQLPRGCPRTTRLSYHSGHFSRASSSL